MTQLIETKATPLADFLAGAAFSSPPQLQSYLGALTPQQLDAIGNETAALLFDAAVHDLGWLRRIEVRGEDRFRWLSGMVTNAVETLPQDGGAYNFILNAQGRIQGDAWVWRNGDSLELELTAAQSPALLEHFDRYIIMDDVELAPMEGQSALGLTGPDSARILSVLGLTAQVSVMTWIRGIAAGIEVQIRRTYGTTVPHYELWVATEAIPRLWSALHNAGAAFAGTEALETLRIVEGIPAYEVDIESRDLVQETSQIRALNFAKGCYLGQEIVERVRSRGQVHRHLRSLELNLDDADSLPVKGTELRIAGSGTDAKSVGTITSAAALHLKGSSRIFAIAMLRAEAEVGNKTLEFANGAALILDGTPKLRNEIEIR
ncbi:YgfZ/GcvT domain-containing protein [Acidicapsa dinghuensis]|uniref:YgfZ/GcvT domain-containing protein n=1 Tax=Acidicapsa dinghuensis TaxID=2218256 RepID=A0ABW1ED35_9BACT|nr:folate-binding protein [Acidicapsa dinghuensis]